METQATTPSSILRYPDAYNLGRAISLIEGLLYSNEDIITRELAEKFLEEMREEKS